MVRVELDDLPGRAQDAPGDPVVMCGRDQGLAWSMTVNMKIGLIGPGRPCK